MLTLTFKTEERLKGSENFTGKVVCAGEAVGEGSESVCFCGCRM